MSAIPAQVYDHQYEWYLYTSTLKKECNGRMKIYAAQTSFEIVLSNSPGPVTMQEQTSKRYEVTEFKQKMNS